MPPGAAEVFTCDVGDLAACAALPERVVARMGGLDALVNNAGFHRRGPLLEVDPRDFAAMVTVNLAAPVVLTRAAAERMRAGGRIVNVASLAGMVPMRLQATYGASKMGLRAFSRAAREELLPRGITVSVVSPGPVDTGFFGEELERVADIAFSQPMSSADEVADAVSPASATARRGSRCPGSPASSARWDISGRASPACCGLDWSAAAPATRPPTSGASVQQGRPRPNFGGRVYAALAIFGAVLSTLVLRSA